jgi:ParB/RepB/Spo0J family partition protein
VNDQLQWLSLDHLVEPPVVLRLVDRTSVAYLELRDSIADWGILNPILVRPSGRFPGKYDVADGFYRVTAAREAGRTPLPCLVKDLTDDDLLAIQIQANALRPETTPAEYARQVKKIIEAHPGVGLPEISSRILHKNPQWVRETLGLLNLRKDYQLAVDRGEVPLGSAYEWARVPYKFQPQFFDAARTMSVAEFRPLVQAFLKQFQEAVRQGKLDAFFTTDFTPVPHGRPWKQVIAEYEEPQCAALVLVAEQCKTLTDAWHAALAWVLHLDRESIEAQRQAVMNRARQPRKEPPASER